MVANENGGEIGTVPRAAKRLPLLSTQSIISGESIKDKRVVEFHLIYINGNKKISNFAIFIL